MAICQFCKGESGVIFKTKDLNRRVSQSDFEYLRCSTCKLISISKIPDDLSNYYAQEYYRIPSFSKLKRIARAERFKINMIKNFVDSGSLLEVGAAFGVFAYQAKEAGFKVDAIEMDDRCCKFLMSVIGVNAIKCDRPDGIIDSLKKHDVIVMWHVLEHLVNPWESLSAMAKNLSMNGLLVVATPNPEAFQFRIMGKHWPHIDAPRHLNLIPEKILTEYLRRFGLEPVMLTTNDQGGKSWNRFGWQRYLMNYFSGKWMQKLFFIAGYLLSFPMILWDQKSFNGCAYTAIFQKKVAT